ncbi:alpha-hydroxy-acid oxidizing protein [Streptomyces sp. NPDC056390]|uniref:alpha-hydroxy-acid oxidizing protein n=1 Tax=Streptomyces sp. NPDC056390 TaxID=3345806 RepID=UPI0035DC3854
MSLRDLAGTGSAPFWFHLCVQRDCGLTRELVTQAEDAGTGALVVTLDTPVAPATAIGGRRP